MRKPDVAGGIWIAGDRIYYSENGEWDTGTVKELRPTGKGRKSTIEYLVEWDNGDETDWYTSGQLKTLQ